MPQLGFQKRFVPAVENGLDLIAGRSLRHPGVPPKSQTIRAYRKDERDPNVGDRLHLYTGPFRPGKRRKLGEATCTEAKRIRIWRRGFYEYSRASPWMPIAISLYGPRGGVRRLTISEAVGIAVADGFNGPNAFAYYFEMDFGLPFEGLLIRWGELEKC